MTDDKYRKIPKGAIKIELPNTGQTKDSTCGPAALLAICRYYGTGPRLERDIEADMKRIGAATPNTTDDGMDPIQLEKAAEEYGLRVKAYRGMTKKQLRKCLDRGRPVVVMIQAWPEKPLENYRDVWTEGHWVIAIGYDKKGFYFEDPSLYKSRGFIAADELDERWHDVEGPDGALQQTDHYGVAIWSDTRSRYATHARDID